MSEKLPIPVSSIGAITESTVGYKDDELDALRKRVYELEREIAGEKQKFAHLQQIYTKLADQWNAFQATAKPEQRFVYRAEAAGELARKLAEVFLTLAYGTGRMDDLISVLTEAADKWHADETVEVSEKLVGPRRG